jgi:hypothetical protein
LGITHGPLNGYVGYGFGDAAATNFTLNNTPYSDQEFVAELDYTIKLSNQLNVNLGGYYSNYTGYAGVQWDPAAILCVGPAGANASSTRYFANTAGSPFVSCNPDGKSPGFTPLVYHNGTPITGYYLGTVANNPTLATAAGGISTTTPGLAIGTPNTMVGGHAIITDGNARLVLEGTIKLGNDPYTGAAWLGNLGGEFLFDYGPWRAGGLTGADHNRGKWTYEAQGFAVQFNGQTQSTNVVGGPILDNSWTTNYGGTFWVEGGIKYWISDTMYAYLGYGHTGLLPNTELPAGSATCPGCVLTGLSQNLGFLQVNMNF